MDAVITYVDGQDPLWLKDYASAVGGNVTAKRFRDWGTLRFLLRGIERHMPFIENVHLVVARESQIPSWAGGRLKPVLHRDIIPGEYLPTFNSTTIEMFLHRIPGLSERFLYFNDDMFPVADCTEEDFFPGGKAAMGFSRNLLVFGKFRHQVRNSDRLARKALGMCTSPFYRRPQHTCSPMLRSESEKMFAAVREDILGALSAVRNSGNFNQYAFLDYLFYQGKAISRRISNKHISMAATTPAIIRNFLSAPTHKLVCINDVNMPEGKAEQYRSCLLEAFGKRYPQKSAFEK